MDRTVFDIRQVGLEWYHNGFPAERMPDFAVWALQNGYDGPRLRELAGLTRVTRSNEGKLIERVLQELGVEPMTGEEAAEGLILRVCNQIVSGEIPAYSGAARIAYDLADSTGESKYFLHWVGLVSEWEDVPSKRDYFEEQILLAAKEFLARAAVGTPSEAVTVHRGRIRLQAVAAGPKHGPVVILLHGFPEFWYGWHRQIEPLAATGFRVIVPD